MVNVGSLLTMLLIVSIFITGLAGISNDISTNPNLDNTSKTLLNNFNTVQKSNFNNSEVLELSSNNLTGNNSKKAGSDTFSVQFLSDTADKSKTTNMMEKIFNVPDLIITSFGIDNINIINSIKSLIISFLIFLIFLASYKFIRTGEVDK